MEPTPGAYRPAVATSTGRLRASGSDDLHVRQIAIAAHELRTPITTIFGFASVLSRWNDGLAPADVDRAIALITQEAGRLRDTVEDLLVLGRMTHSTLAPVAVDVGHLVIESLQAAPPPAGTAVRTHLPSPGAPVKALGDGGSLVPAIVNLLTNAYRYGGPSVTVTARRHRDYVKVEVEDDGRGVPPDLVPTLFDLFTRGGDHDDDRADPSGMGIGLAIAKHGVESSGGRLEHRAVEPHGARSRSCCDRTRTSSS